jgi:hypothetical protein
MTAWSSFVGAGTTVLLIACVPTSVSKNSHSTEAEDDGGVAGEATGESNGEPELGDDSDSEAADEAGGCFVPSDGMDVSLDWPACNLVIQDCPEGEKCVPYASSGGTWDRVTCVPVSGEGVAGEPCTTVGAALSAQDDCGATSFCAGYDEDKLGGVCHPFCTGDLRTPQCIDGWACSVPSDDWYLCESPVYCVES